LVVDDERNLADLVASWLEEAGIATTVAYDAAEALRLVAEATPDLLVTDVNLGNGKNGADIAAELRNVDASAVVVFMTAYADRVRILQESGTPTLAKPFTAAELLEVIRRSGSSSAGA
ncbi:MAG: response regulator transcription factor, partial [Ilumatobacteraceae bacterium]